MGILDNKSRIVDTVITEEGRHQLAMGKMRIEYYSFTDGDVFYQSSSLGVTDDASARFCFESTPYLPQDLITPEADDSGLISIKRSINLDKYLYGGRSSEVVSGSTQFISGAVYASNIEGLLSSSVDNFKDLTLIRSINRVFDDLFILSTGSLTFDARIASAKKVDVNSLDPFRDDMKMSLVDNFSYLPPIKKLDKNTVYDPQASYEQVLPPIGRESFPPITMGNINRGFNKPGQKLRGLNYTKNVGLAQDINITSTTAAGKLAFQVFEIDDSVTRKLDMLDLGVLDPVTGERVVFLGKLAKKQDQEDVFMQIFVLVFSRS